MVFTYKTAIIPVYGIVCAHNKDIIMIKRFPALNVEII